MVLLSAGAGKIIAGLPTSDTAAGAEQSMR